MRRNALVLTWAVTTAAGLALGACSDKSNDRVDAGSFGNAPNAGNGSAGNGIAGNVADPEGDGMCADGFVRASLVNPRVILVLDGSCSMTTDYPANGQGSSTRCQNNPNGRWAALRNALISQGSGVVSRLQGVVSFGLVVYGTRPQCPIPMDPIQPALDNLQAISDALPNVQPGDYTPTGAALDWVYENMILPPEADVAPVPQIVILATDGEPNSCGDANTNYPPSVEAVTKGAQMGVKTYVISLADSTGEFHDHLQSLADLGAGVVTGAKLYEPTTPEQLEADLQTLVGGAVGCDIALNGAVDEARACEGMVSLNGVPLTCNDPNGFVLSDSRHLKLQGSACQQLLAMNDSVVDAKFPCGVFMVD